MIDDKQWLMIVIDDGLWWWCNTQDPKVACKNYFLAEQVVDSIQLCFDMKLVLPYMLICTSHFV